MILSVVVYGYKTWCFKFSEEQKQKAFKDKTLREICGPKWQENGLNCMLGNLVTKSLPNQTQIPKSRGRKWSDHVTPTGERQNSEEA
jgi:hypothetical protein